MHQEGINILPVYDRLKLVGVIDLETVENYLKLRLRLAAGKKGKLANAEAVSKIG